MASESLKRSRAVSEAVEWAVVALASFIAGILALDRLGIPLTTLVAPATVIGIGLGFGAQQMVGDLLAGFFLLTEHQFAFGDLIRLSVPGQAVSVTGTVEELTLRVTKLRNAPGRAGGGAQQRDAPGHQPLARTGRGRSIDIPVAVTEDLGQVTSLLKDVVAQMAADPRWKDLLLGPPVVAGVETIDVGYVQLRLIARTLPGRQFEVAREIRLAGRHRAPRPPASPRRRSIRPPPDPDERPADRSTDELRPGRPSQLHRSSRTEETRHRHATMRQSRGPGATPVTSRSPTRWPPPDWSGSCRCRSIGGYRSGGPRC